MGKGGGACKERPAVFLGDDSPALLAVPPPAPAALLSAIPTPAAEHSVTEEAPRLPKEEWIRENRIEAAKRMEDLEAGIEKIRENPALYKKWLDDLSSTQMYDYSLMNYMLLSTQRDNLTRVASFNKWKKLGRSVSKGEKSLKVLVPMTKAVPVKDANGVVKLKAKGKPVTRQAFTGHFKLGPVFDVSQTEPVPGGDTSEPAEREGATQCIADLTAVAEKHGVEVHLGGVEDESSPYRHLLNAQLLLQPNAGGYYLQSTRTDAATGEEKELRAIVTRKGHSPEEEARVVAHELAHAVLEHQGYASHEDRAQKELEAEACAYVLSTSYGISNDFSAAYITNWNGNDANSKLRKTAETVRKTVRDIFIDLEELDAKPRA